MIRNAGMKKVNAAVFAVNALVTEKFICVTGVIQQIILAKCFISCGIEPKYSWKPFKSLSAEQKTTSKGAFCFFKSR